MTLGYRMKESSATGQPGEEPKKERAKERFSLEAVSHISLWWYAIPRNHARTSSSATVEASLSGMGLLLPFGKIVHQNGSIHTDCPFVYSNEGPKISKATLRERVCRPHYSAVNALFLFLGPFGSSSVVFSVTIFSTSARSFSKNALGLCSKFLLTCKIGLHLHCSHESLAELLILL
ncbi:hypothetical protein AVEN_48034-1 [Araneus ventricosus]|uniref:Uncharacterized protein n=1 Tax=Araneus ventricosus TaxID=182803 RepID=A0A4Y2M051_ARAVE|nr:hypothetical protein AVEN_48034-1 [Araneus ventricosus]